MLLAPSISAMTARSLRMEARAAIRPYTRIAAQAHSRAPVTVVMMISRSLCRTFRLRYVFPRFIASKNIRKTDRDPLCLIAS